MKKKTKGKVKCPVCGHRFLLEKENKYIVDVREERYENGTGFGVAIVTYEQKDCFDCPECGCQVVTSRRIGSKRYR